MKIQEQFVDNENGQQYWKIYFEFLSTKQLTIEQFELINNKINKMINEFEIK